jgi:hypothetical protein
MPLNVVLTVLKKVFRCEEAIWPDFLQAAAGPGRDAFALYQGTTSVVPRSKTGCGL